MIFSIIITAYNVEEYIGQCIESVLCQKFGSFEIIVVEDASIDNTKLVIDSYKYRDPRIILLENKQNRGVAFNRNAGINIAKGKWILFLDGDDYYDDNEFLYKLYKKCCNTDIVIFGFTYICSSYKSRSFSAIDIEQINLMSSNIDRLRFLSKNGFLYHTVFNVCFKKKYLIDHSIQFFECLKQAEDLEFLYRVLFLQPEIKALNSYQYMWRRDNKKSLTKDVKDELKNTTKAFSQLMSLLEYRKVDVYEKIVLDCIANSYFAYLINCKKSLDKFNFRQIILQNQKMKIYLNYGSDKNSLLLSRLIKLCGYKKGLNIGCWVIKQKKSINALIR